MSVLDHSRTTFVTLTDERFFLGTVALVNSLRLTGNTDDVLVVDAGLTPHQARQLGVECEIRPLAIRQGPVLPAFLKPAAVSLALELGLGGAIILIDSDMIVTDSLRPVLRHATEGRICLLPDGPPHLQDRRFEEWVSILGLQADLRPQPYVNSGFIAFRADLWGPTLRRWRELCERVAERRSRQPHAISPDEARSNPFAYLDQDVLNAILMSEIGPDRIGVLDWQLAGVPEPGDTTRLIDRKTLLCRNDGGTTLLLHHFAHPKPWLPEARTHLRFEPYEELFARLLAGDDVPIRLRREDVPAWMRDGRARRLIRRVGRSRARPMRLLHRVQPVR